MHTSHERTPFCFSVHWVIQYERTVSIGQLKQILFPLFRNIKIWIEFREINQKSEKIPPQEDNLNQNKKKEKIYKAQFNGSQ